MHFAESVRTCISPVDTTLLGKQNRTNVSAHDHEKGVKRFSLQTRFDDAWSRVPTTAATAAVSSRDNVKQYL